MDELGNKKNKCEDKKAEESVAYDFADNIAIQDAHGAKGECNMRERGSWVMEG
jgi:hypothetical protein